MSFTPQNGAQQALVDTIDRHDVTFALGGAGTGKSYVTVAKAVAALKAGDIGSIILCVSGPATAGNAGFLPGSADDKLQPFTGSFMAQLDALYGPGSRELIKESRVEILSPALLRGKTLQNTFVILDDAETAMKDEIATLASRLGAGSKLVICGDAGTTGAPSPLQKMATQLANTAGIGVYTMPIPGAEQPLLRMTFVEVAAIPAVVARGVDKPVAALKPVRFKPRF